MNPVTRLAAVLLGLALPGTLLLYESLFSTPDPRDFDLGTISREAAGYRQTAEDRLTPDVLAQIEPDAYRFWLYRKSGAPPIWNYMAFYRGIVFTGAHDPAVCYPAQGWDIRESRTLKIPMDDGTPLHARLLRTDLNGREEMTLYWFQPAARWPGAAWAEQLLRIWDSLRGSPQYAFVRLSAPASQATEAMLVRFARAIAPDIRKVVAVARVHRERAPTGHLGPPSPAS